MIANVNRQLILFVAAIALVIPVGGAQVVRVQKPHGDGSFGHGFVFGSVTDGACWLATPAHVVLDNSGNTSEVSLTSPLGDGGYANDFVRPDENLDLIFGRVRGLGNQCSSRLPVGDIERNIQPGGNGRLTVLETAFGGTRTIPVRIRNQSLGGRFSIEPIATASDRNPKILQGFSGALVDVIGGAPIGNGDQAIGLILSVCDGVSIQSETIASLFGEGTPVSACSDGHYANVLSTEVIRAEFDSMAARLPNSVDAETSWDLISYSGLSVEGTPHDLHEIGDCWTVTAPAGSNHVSIELEITSDNVMTKATISTCGADPNLKQVVIGANQDQFKAPKITEKTTEISVGNRSQRKIWLKLYPHSPSRPIALEGLAIGTTETSAGQ